MQSAILRVSELDKRLSVIDRELKKLDEQRLSVSSGEAYNSVIRSMSALDEEFHRLRLEYFDLIDGIYGDDCHRL